MGLSIHQGYLSDNETATVRVRTKGNKAFITIKSKTVGITRLEFEYEIPVDEALELLKLCADRTLTKTRFELEHGGKIWELDVFAGRHEGLLLAEIELSSESEGFTLPPWLGEEVSTDPRYFNSFLASH